MRLTANVLKMNTKAGHKIWRIKSVSPGEILPDRSLRYRDPLDQWRGALALRRSIQRHGVLDPVLLRETPAGLQMVSGFRRLQVATEERLTGIPAQVVQGDAGQLFVQVVESHSGQDSSVREQARAVAVGLELGWSVRRVARDLLPALGLEPSANLASRYARLRGLPVELMDLLAVKSFSLRRHLPFCDLPRADCQLLAAVATGLGLGGRQIEEVSTELREVAAREGLALAQVVQQLELDQQEQVTTEALARLEQRRYPEASRRRRQIGELGRELAQGRVDVRFDRNFTRDGVDLSFHVNSVQQLRELSRELGADHSLELICQILEKQ